MPEQILFSPLDVFSWTQMSVHVTWVWALFNDQFVTGSLVSYVTAAELRLNQAFERFIPTLSRNAPPANAILVPGQPVPIAACAYQCPFPWIAAVPECG